MSVLERSAKALGEVRRSLAGPERLLLDVLAEAGALGFALPYSSVNLQVVSGPRDPRRRLRALVRASCVDTARPDPAWERMGRRLGLRLARALEGAPRTHSRRALRVLLGNATVALAPHCAVPRGGPLRGAWFAAVSLFAALYPSAVKPLPALPWLDAVTLAGLRRESRAGGRAVRAASGRRPGPLGRALAVDPRLMSLVGAALGRRVRPGFEARYVFYTRAGDHFWPHPDDPEYEVNVLVCIDRRLPPGASSGSAFLAYRPSGRVERHEVACGAALAVEAQGLVHGREPLLPGERVVMLSIAARARPAATT